MALDKELFKEIEIYEKKEFADDSSIQGALSALGVYVADIDPNDCREDVRLIVDLAHRQPEFIEISEDKEATKRRVYYYIEAMQDPNQLANIIDRAVHVVTQGLARRAVDWMTRICNESGSTEAKKKKLHEIEAKLTAVDR